MSIFLEMIAYLLFSIKFLFNVMLFILCKIIILILIIFRVSDLENLENLKLTDFLKSEEEKERKTRYSAEEIRPIRFNLWRRLYYQLYPKTILTPQKINKINALFKEYESKNELSERMYYNILYASKFWGFIYRYIGFSRRKYYYIDEKGGFSQSLLIKFVSQHYILSSKMLLDYFIENNNPDEIYKFYVAVINYSRYAFTDCSDEKNIIFKETMKSIFSKQKLNFDKNFEKDNMLIITNKIISDNKNRDDYYLDLLFNSLFYINDMNFSEKRRSYFIETLNIYLTYETIKQSNRYLIEKLYQLLPKYIENEKEKPIEDSFDFKYLYQPKEERLFNSIENNILLLKEIGQNMDEVLSLIPDHQNLKKLHYYKLENKLSVKNLKEAVKKI